MRASSTLTSLLPFLLASSTAATSSSTICPFIAPFIDQSRSYPINNEDPLLDLFRRQQNNCPIGYNSCSKLGAANVCCSVSAVCSADAANDVACCPSGAQCTGTIGATGSVTGAVTDTGTTAGGGFIFGSATTTASTTGPITSSARVPQSTVANAYFPFLYIPTSFANAAVCSSYYSSCGTEFSSCTASIGGGINGVTVTGGGAGITVQGATASAASICSSLSSQACYNLQLGDCPQFGTAAATGSGVIVVSSAIKETGVRTWGLVLGVVVTLLSQIAT